MYMTNEIYFYITRPKRYEELCDKKSFHEVINRFTDSNGVSKMTSKSRVLAKSFLIPKELKWKYLGLAKQYHYSERCMMIIAERMIMGDPDYCIDFLSQYHTYEALAAADKLYDICKYFELIENGFKSYSNFAFTLMPYSEKMHSRRCFMKVDKKPYYHRSSIENTLAQMPRYNAYACGHGEHESKKRPNRAKQKEQFRKEIRDY